METFGKYQVIRRLGSGGMAEVFLVREPLAQGLSKILVLKKIHPALAETPQFRQMFEDEAKVAVNLNHPNIVQTFGYGQIGPTYYLAMEHVEGLDLLRLLNHAAQASQRIPFGLSAYLGQQLAKALDYAHRKTDELGQPLGIVHRDISPQNVLVSWDGMVKLVDFGIARARHVREDEGVVKGKFAYMSPEQAQGHSVDPRSDIFSMGIVLWELTCGRSLFGNLKAREARSAIKSAQVPRPREIDPAVPGELEEIILRALARRPEERFQTARDLHRALGKFFFELSAREGKIFESGAMAAFIAQVVPKDAADPAPPAESAGSGAVSEARSQVRRAQSPSGETGSLPLSERRQVVVVEGELSGLGALRRQVGEARAREALLDFLRISEHVAYKHAAHPDRLDERGFTYVVGLPVSAEDDSARALKLATALIEALDGISRELDPPLKLAIGVQRGVALVSRPPSGDAKFSYELIGRTAELARRLSGEAMPGEVLAGGGVFRAARGEWRFEELEAIELPLDPDTSPGVHDDPPASEGGRAAARARVYRLKGARPRAERLADEPTALRLVGRDLELGTLREAHRAVVELQRARHVVILGDAGVGKRSIVDAFRRGLDPATHLVLRAVGRPSLKDTPYALVADLTRDLLGVSEETEPREIKRRIDAAAQLLFRADEARESRHSVDALSLLLGLSVPGAEELDPGERRHRLHAAMRRIEARLAEERTLVVAIEDLHWADQQSFDILLALVREPLSQPVLGVATARHDERMAELAQSPHVTTILVGELSARERVELVAARFEDTAEAQALAGRIVDRAGGNPFYLNEILESLIERQILQPVDGTSARSGKLRWVKRDEPFPVPTTVEAVVASRLDRLPDDERDAIRRAALLGRQFRVEDLAALLGSDPCSLLVRLSARGLITPSSGADDTYRSGPAAYAFRNLITKEVAYSGLAPDTRALLHSVAADRFRRSPRYRKGADDALLAEHLEAAGDRPAAARALIEAGVYARDSAGNAEAWRLFTRALELLPADAVDERYLVHAEREQVLRGWGKRPAQLREVHAMRKAAVAAPGAIGLRREAEASCRMGLLYLDVGKHAAARRELDRALKAAREAKDPLVESEALRLESLLLMNIGKNAEAIERAREALSVLGEPAAEGAQRPLLLARAQALNAVGNVHVHTGRLRDAVSAYAEALVIQRRLGERRLEAATLNNMGWVFVGLGEYEEAQVHYKRSLRIAQELGDRAGVGVKLANIGQTYADLGDFERARRYLDKASELHQALGDQPGMADALISLAQVSLREGRTALAARDLERGLELASETRNRYQEIRALVYLAFCKLQSGDPPDGPLELARSATRLAREAEIANGAAYGLCAEALSLVRSGREKEALERSTQAVALLDAGRDVDGPEEILHLHAKVARAAGATELARVALRRAFVEVQRKARRLHDDLWRARYLEAPPAREIVTDAREAGLDGPLADGEAAPA